MSHIPGIGAVGPIFCLLAWAGIARADAHIQFIDMGTPTNGSVVMTGWRGVVVRVTLDGGLPITRVFLGDPRLGSIYGDLAQRWTDPTGHGAYTQTDPGPLTANNTFASELNFDSHFLGIPEMYDIEAIGKTPGVGFFPARTGLPSDYFTGYTATMPGPSSDPFELIGGGRLGGTFRIRPEFQESFLDLAYVVTASTFVASASIDSGSQVFEAEGTYTVPEPSCLGLAISATVTCLLRRRRKPSGEATRILLESLKSRRQLSVSAPAGVTASVLGSGAVAVSWADVADETGYWVERSDDGGTNWWAVHGVVLPPGQTQFTDTTILSGTTSYRVRAVDGTTSAASVSVPVSSSTFAVESEPRLGGGIRLKWSPLPSDAPGGVTVFRWNPMTSSWVSLLPEGQAALPLTQTFFDDLAAQDGYVYEYRVSIAGTFDFRYLYGANAAPATHSHGTALLVIDQTLLDADGESLQDAVDLYSADLIGEGYHVATRTVSRADVPHDNVPRDESTWYTNVIATKSVVRQVWENHPDLTNVVLIGHVPVPYSGIGAADGHDDNAPPPHYGAWPTDMFYSTLSAPDIVWTNYDTQTKLNASFPANANYPGDGKFDLDVAPALPDVAVGRIDFAGMTLFGASSDANQPASDGEITALRNYFAKNHQYRTDQWDVRHQAIVDRNWSTPVQTGYFPTEWSANVGSYNIRVGRASVSRGESDKSDHDLNSDTWLWASIAAGGAPGAGGDYIHLGGLDDGTDPAARYFSATDYASSGAGSHKAVFSFIFGSYLGDWDRPNSPLRASLGESDGYGLAAAWGARPPLRIHRMGLGDTIGQALVLTQVNGLTANQYDARAFGGSVDVSLMGDPTLRQDTLRPVGDVTAAPDPGGNVISWQASGDINFEGYYVYRATDPNGPWARLNATLLTEATYTDPAATDTAGYYYMVRADRLQVTPSGSYHNLSVGIVSRPALVSSTFRWEGHVPTPENPWKQWVDLAFSQEVSLTPDLLTLDGQAWDGANHVLVPRTLQYGVDFQLVADPAARTRRLVFLDPATGGAAFAPNGVWTLTVAADTANSFGRSMGADQTFAFTFLIADANNDNTVNFSDMAIMAQNYNMTTPDPDYPHVWGDFNADGVVNFSDMALLAQLYNVTL